jgi:mono/diheme cytochrome c family protein
MTAHTRPGRRAKLLAGVALIALLITAVLRSGTGAAPHATLPASQSTNGAAGTVPDASGRPLLDRYCVTCHNARLKTAGLVLDRDALDVANVGSAIEVWEKVARKMRSQAMPPVGARRPQPAEYEAFSTWLEGALDSVAAAHPNPGRSTVHRLNRAEYANAVRDLLGVEIDARAYLPPDDSGYGFDNVADVLSVSPGLLERYLLAAGKVARLAVADPSIKPAIATYRVPPLFAQNDRASEDLPFGSRGGLAVRHHFPVDGRYVFKVRLQRTYSEIIRGMTSPSTLELRLDRELVRSFTVGARAGAPAADIQEQSRNGDANLEVQLDVNAGVALVGVAFVKQPKVAEGVFEPNPPLASFEYSGKSDTDPAIDTIQIVGPYDGTRPRNSATRDRVFVCTPPAGESQAGAARNRDCARRILTGLARRAYRRPVSEADVRALLAVFDKGGAEGGFETGISWAIERILVAPDFLFRIERDPAGAKPGVPFRISDEELASRLSFFLWSSIPDDELLDAATRGSLSQPAVLSAQLRRMLADSRSQALIDNFAGRWLYLRNVRAHAPDPNLFADFDDNLRDAFTRETELFLASQIREDRGVVDLLRADYTFVNERLARHYGIPGVYGSHFRRVTLPDDRRAGLLGQGSVLTVTSYAHRTSPVLRGRWVLENLLGAPPPPPPADIPALKENGEGGASPTSVRERLEAHRANPTCASCHARMDPLGFALENFDAIGRWRDTDESGKVVDASGVLPDGTAFRGPAEFRRALLSRQREFVGTLTEKLLTYALGRGLEPYDMPAVRAIVRRSAQDDYRWSAIVAAIADSVPFRMRTLLPPERSSEAATARARGADQQP